MEKGYEPLEKVYFNMQKWRAKAEADAYRRRYDMSSEQGKTEEVMNKKTVGPLELIYA